jgi:phytanoyl-CoA hydroxylase
MWALDLARDAETDGMVDNSDMHPWRSIEPYGVGVDEYRAFRRDGYLLVPRLVLPEHVDELRRHAEDLLAGRASLPGASVTPDESLKEREQKLHRVHMGHRDDELWERYLLYPRVLDVVAALTGPDVLALQTMLFIKGPGADGQGFHQDSYYVPTFPDSLIGAWIAIDPADEENGCLRVCAGSQSEPIYPPEHGYGFGDTGLKDIPHVRNVGGHSNDDEDEANTLRPIAERYRDVEVPVRAAPGDVIFFGGHVFHRSLRNRSEDRYRRCLVNHYCNARSYTDWDGGTDRHILARGATHLPFAKPRFGTPCAATEPTTAKRAATPTMMMAKVDGGMEARRPES